MTKEYTCGYGHVVSAKDLVGPVDLEGSFCPACMGAVKASAPDPRLLVPLGTMKECCGGH